MSLAGDSPAASAMGEPATGDAAKKDLTHITFQFCKECSNMLYPKEDTDSSTLMFACRTCTFKEPAASACVFRNILSNTVGETEGVTQDVASDPTVGSPDFCVMCGQHIICEVCDESVVGSGSDGGGDEYDLNRKDAVDPRHDK